jgi:hypothetical protein
VYTVDDGTAPVQGTIHMSVVGDAVTPGTVFFSAQDNPSELNPDLYAVGPNGVVSAHPISAPDGSLAGIDGGYYQFGGNLYFNASSAATGVALFRLDSTGVATAVGDGAGGYFGDPSDDANFTEFDGSLYFRAISPTAGDQVVRLNEDGSSETIVIQAGGQSSQAAENGGFTAFDGGLWFSALTGGHAGADLIRLESNGSFADISTRASGNEAFGSFSGEDGGFVAFNNALYFNSYSDTLGDTLFRVDAGSTTPVAVDSTGSELAHLFSGTNSAFHIFNGSLWFNEFSFSVGDDTLFQLDTSGALTPFTFNGEALNGAGALGGFVDFAGSSYFVASTNSDGAELFALDASGDITRITDTIGDSFDGNLVSGFAVFDGALYFDAYNGVGLGDDLFKLDSLGNLTAVDLGSGTGTGSTTHAGIDGGFQVANDSLYFSAYTPNGNELVRLDADGTVTAYDLNPGAGENSFAGQNGGFGVFPAVVHDGTSGDDILVGGRFGETLNGNDGNDVLYGRHGNDTIHGGTGNDSIRPGPGADRVYGEDDNDVFIFHASLRSSDIIDGGAGRDTLSLDGDYSLGLTFLADTITAIETIVLHAGFSYRLVVNDANVAAGESLKVDGSHLLPGDSLLFGGSAEQDGVFHVIGGAGGDNLKGGSGRDILRGGDGNDILRGGQGGDILVGDAGADIFVYTAVEDSPSAAFDSINDFDASTDTIDLWFQVTGIDAPQTGSLNNLANKFDAAHLLVHHAALATIGSHAFLVVEANGVAGYQAGQDLVIKVDGMTGALNTGNFI